MEFDIKNTDPSYVALYGLNHSIESLEGIIKKHKETYIMSAEDTKVCLIFAMIALKKQMQVNESLRARLEKLETKKKFRLRFWM